MFSNFLYFLIALVIYATSDLFEPPSQTLISGLYYGILAGGLFALVCHLSFKRLDQRRGNYSAAGLDHRVTVTISRLSVAALVLFAADIHLLHLNRLLSELALFRWVPTLGALVFLGVFLIYLVLIWTAAYRLQQRYVAGRLTQRSFVFSNIAFALPALLPWVCLSLFADLIEFLPFKSVKAHFHSTLGEAIYILVFLSAVSVLGPVLIKRLWGCHPLEPGWARSRIEAVCGRSKLVYRDILRWELFGGTMITAGVMGIVGRFRYILVTDALLGALDDEEIEGVMLHEIGHVRHRHMLYYLVFFLGFVACNFVLFEPAVMLVYVIQPVYRAFELIGISRSTAHPVMICLGLILSFVIYFRVGFGFFMRNFERQADLHIFSVKPGPSALISTFYKIASLSRQSIDAPNWHHYSIGQRIRFLERCREDPEMILQHHRRVRRMMIAYLAIVLAVFSLGYSVSYGALKSPFERFIAGRVLAQQLEVDPENSDLYALVGDYYYNENRYVRAMGAYENVLRIDPENVHALNNLAWLLATCPNDSLRDGTRALELAARALSYKRESYVLDTYAEALLLNRRAKEALSYAREALALASDQKAYYQEQVARFTRAVNDG